MSFTADIDTGGTFTDGYFSDGERYWLAKVETTPHDFTVGFLACLGEGARRMGLGDVRGLLRRCDVIRFCTTLTTNALVQGQGTKLGLITSRALADHLPAVPGANALVMAELVAVLDQADATASKPQPDDVVRAARLLLGRGARALVVALPRAAAEPANEGEVQRILDAEYPPHLLGHVPVTLSHQVSRRPEDVLRATAALLNARLHALLARSLRETEDALRERAFVRPLLVVHADGGCARVAKTRAIETCASGPAAVAHGAARLCGGRRETSIAMDIGGTTTDLAFVTSSAPRLVPMGKLRGHAVGQPLPEVWSLGVGGGSIARLGAGKLSVGPESAGGLPGPASFDLGGSDATVTDACLALGFFAPERFFGGRRRLHPELAARAIKRLSADVAPERTALAIKEALEDQVAAAIREHGAGIDFHGARLLALGGGGGLHAASIATRLGLCDVDVFPFSPAFGAFGASTLDVVHAYQAPLEGLGANDGRLSLGPWFRDLVAAARRDMEDEGFAAIDLTFELVVELAPVTPGGTPTLVRQTVLAEQEHVTLSGSGSPHMAWLRARSAIPCGGEPRAFVAAPSGESKLGTRQVHWGESERPTEVFLLEALVAEARLGGPCLVESEFATLAIPPGWTFTLEPNGWMHLHA